MGLFDLKGDKIVLDPDKLIVPEFRAIWDQDKSKDKAVAEKMITYIYFLCDYNSPYASYPEEKKEEELMRDLKMKVKEVSTVEMKLAILKYKEFQETHSMRLLRSARVACDKMADYFREVDFAAADDQGKLKYNAKDVAANIAAVGKMIESLDKVEEKVKKEITTSSQIRGGGTEGSYER